MKYFEFADYKDIVPRFCQPDFSGKYIIYHFYWLVYFSIGRSPVQSDSV